MRTRPTRDMLDKPARQGLVTTTTTRRESDAATVLRGGCMLAIRDRMGDIAAPVAESHGGAPFLAVFSFGEQGKMPYENCLHGNLMISTMTFGCGKPPQTEQAE